MCVCVCVCSNRIRTLVAMATYSFHRLIMGKEEIYISISMGILELLFFSSQKCLLSSPLHFIRLLYKSLNLIGCQGHKKSLFQQKC